LSQPNPSPNAFPKLCERLSARFQKKGRGRTVPSFACSFDANFIKIKHDLIRPVSCSGEVLRFFKTSQSFDQITTLTYVLMDNFLSLFQLHLPLEDLSIGLLHYPSYMKHKGAYWISSNCEFSIAPPLVIALPTL
jgi:hypothetical protein